MTTGDCGPIGECGPTGDCVSTGDQLEIMGQLETMGQLEIKTSTQFHICLTHFVDTPEAEYRNTIF